MKRVHFPRIAGLLAILLAVPVLIYGQTGSATSAEDEATVGTTEQREIATHPPKEQNADAGAESAAAEASEPRGGAVAPSEAAPVRHVSTRQEVVIRDVTTEEAPASQDAAQTTEDDVLARLRATYEGLDALRARFTQQVGAQTLEGTIVLSGDRYRIELPGQILVSDGTTAWAYSAADNQVLINHHIDEDSGFTPSDFFSRYPEEFHVERTGAESIGGVRHEVLELTPRHPNAHVRAVTMYVRASDALPTRVRILDGHGTALVFELQNIEKNPRLAAGTFRLRTPTGAEVIDMR